MRIHRFESMTLGRFYKKHNMNPPKDMRDSDLDYKIVVVIYSDVQTIRNGKVVLNPKNEYLCGIVAGLEMTATKLRSEGYGISGRIIDHGRLDKSNIVMIDSLNPISKGE